MDAKEFAERTGHLPEQDDLERVNCEHAGEIGHSCCGWCYGCDAPRFQCTCRSLTLGAKQQRSGREVMMVGERALTRKYAIEREEYRAWQRDMNRRSHAILDYVINNLTFPPMQWDDPVC